MSKANPITKASVSQIMSKRSLVPASAKRTRFLVDSDGTDVDVLNKEGEQVFSTRAGEEGTVLRKRIFNLRANSETAMLNPRNKEYYKNGLRAELAGGTFVGIIGNETKPIAHTADEWFSAYLNSCQISFGVLLPNRLIDAGILQRGTEIVANMEVIETANGKTVTIDASTIAATAPESYGKTTFAEDAFALTAEEIAALTAPAKPVAKAGTKK